MVSEFIELRSPTGNNRPTGNNSPARFLGIWGEFGLFGRTRCAPTGFGGIWVIWAHAMRPYGFLGGWAQAMRPYGFFGGIWAQAMRPYGFLGEFGFFGFFWGYLGARDAPLRVFGGIWFFWVFLGLFGRTRCAPTGFGRSGRRKTPASS
ncbi:hypothetical protein PN482_18930 [Microcystis aeruginosa CS-555/01A07]|uniref:hypothetical protein n=1 Tax=Microcystis aeruginosa TaxID=1126 RepID=UPI00232C8E60|nr:hypothetical protein [Microcystis aeruginosa]MDB9430910.1 hypothetical protein [Microcystis aeruginosa CS-555/01A07]